MNYANAWKCNKCPESNGPQGCPAWTELVEANAATGEERLSKACLFSVLPRLMVEVIKASNRPAAAVESLRNETLSSLDVGFKAVATVLGDGMTAIAAAATQKALPPA